MVGKTCGLNKILRIFSILSFTVIITQEIIMVYFNRTFEHSQYRQSIRYSNDNFVVKLLATAILKYSLNPK